MVWSAINLFFFTIIIDLFDGVNAESYFAVLAFANGSSTLLGALSGGLLAGVLKDYTVQFSGFQFFGIQALFVGTIVLRLFAWRLLKRVNTRKTSSVPKLILSSTSVVSARIARWPRETIAVFEAIKERYDNRKKRHLGSILGLPVWFVTSMSI
ncbi:MAG: Major Facilitator Superfamily transporter [Thermotogales bacterium 46_20]|nr:MAG: Major Facilitator Superfamily transporter [Thermotogales bacterium 46_20]